MYQILLVDDEPNVLSALQRELQDDYAVQTFSDPLKALQYSEKNHFDLVISDYKMPEMNGIEFLKQFGKLEPDAIRLILSGQADFNALIGSINETHIYRFLDKPWNKNVLATTVAEALAHREQVQVNLRLAECCRQQLHWQRAQNPDRIYQVLVVDDEPNMLSAIARDMNARGNWHDLLMSMLQQVDPTIPLERRDLRFNVVTATSPVMALERAKQFNYDVVISDYLMPEMDGLRFLEAFRKIQPDAARILLSGQANKDVLVKAINNSEIYGYISKPWHEYALISTLSKAIDYHDLLRENRLLAKQAKA